MRTATGTGLAFLVALATAAPAAFPQADTIATPFAPLAGTTWQISLSEPIDATKALVPDVAVYDIDLYDTSVESLAAFKAKGKRVICYFSAGSYEPGRPDSADFQAADLGSVMDGWPDEKWINVKSVNVRSIMSKRIALAKQKGCDGIDPDNVDAYGNSNGLGLTEADAVDYLNFLAGVAKQNSIAIGLKNSGEIVPQVLPNMQFAVVEQCHQYSECDLYKPFIQAGKPVFSIEYPAEATEKLLRRRDSPLQKRAADVVSAAASVVSKFCASSASDSDGFSVVIKTLALDQSLQMCPAVALSGNTSGVIPAVNASTQEAEQSISKMPTEQETTTSVPTADEEQDEERPSTSTRPQRPGRPFSTWWAAGDRHAD